MKFIRLSGIMICLVFMISVLPLQADVRERVREANGEFRDVVLTARVIQANTRELQKIGRDFSKGYDIKTTTIYYKMPNRMRIEGKVGFAQVVMLINGDTKAFKIPTWHFSNTENIKGKPHKRQTELDLGILTTSLWDDYIVTATDVEHSTKGDLLKIVFVRSNARDKNIAIWADAKTMKMEKMEKYESDGSLKARYIYSDHKESNGIWVPGRIDVYNKDLKLAASTAYGNIHVNGGIADSHFLIK